MRRLIVEEWLSIDGCAEDRNGKLDFFPSSEANRYADEVQLKLLETVDTILLGRKTYELFVDFWPTATTDKEIIADRLNEIPKKVFSNSLKKAPWGTWQEAQVESGDAVDAIRKLKQLPGQDMIVWGSITLTQSLIRADLIDLYRFRICPTATGGGRTLFPEFEQYKSLKLVDQGAYKNGIVHLSYVPVG
jgi:dihydrofolate reductase